jgi:hypothetical protein
MGWSNYIIIKDWKIIIETDRGVDSLEDYIKKSLDNMINNDEESIDLSSLKISDITVKELCTLATAYDNANSLAFMEVDKLVLYWLKNKNIEYEIKQEFGFDFKKYETDGYKLISKLSRWKDKDGCDKE